MSINLRFLIFAFLLLFGCHKQQEPPKAPLTVTAFKVFPGTLPARFISVGVAESSHPVEIHARVESYLNSIEYKEGEFVKAGKILFQLDPSQFLASLYAAKAELAREEAILWRAKKSVERFTPLYQQRAASERDLDNAIAQELAASAQVEAAKARVFQAELNLSYTTIRSPIDGLTSKANYREGTLVLPNSSTGHLTTVSVIDPIWINFSLSESDWLSIAVQVSKGQLQLPEDKKFAVTLTLSDGTCYPFIGSIDFSAPTFSKETGTMMVRAVFPNPHGVIRPGQFAQATAEGALYPNALFVPQQSVQQGEKGLYVYVIDAEDIVHMRQVEVGKWEGSNWIINFGLQKGDLVVVDGINKINPGDKVIIKQIINDS